MNELSVIKKDWRNIDLSFGLVYPNQYELGLSSYTIRLLYYMINSYENYVCERIFLPNKIKYPASQLLSSELDIKSVENQISPIEFDILGFSIHYENDLKNILWILEKVGIPFDSKIRTNQFNKDKITFPLLIGGGHVVTSNPLPLSKIFDLFFIGDSEPNLQAFLNKFIKFKSKRLSYHQFLQKLQEVEGIYIPSLKNNINRVILKSLDESPIPPFQLISKSLIEQKAFEKNFFIEVNRGCPFQCKFCISSFHNFPFRNRSFASIQNTIEQAVLRLKFEKISLIGSCVSAHPKFHEICEYILAQGKKLSIPSIRIDHITPSLINILERAKTKSITIAPEAGSESFRQSLGKSISDEKIYDVLRLIKDSKIRNVKFYFLIGLPGETDDDIDQIIQLLTKISDFGYPTKSLRININPFIPKFNTPYEDKIDYYLSKNIKNLVSKYLKLEKALKTIASIQLKFQNPKLIVKNARIQTIFSLGDQHFSELLIKYYQYGGNYGALRRAEKEVGISIDDYLLNIQKGYRPWKINLFY